jgi:isoamylase
VLEPCSNARRAQYYVMEGELGLGRGKPLPLGASRQAGGVNLAVFSRHATSVTLVLFGSDDERPCAEFALDPRYHRTGDVWHGLVTGVSGEVRYGFRADRQPNDAPHIHRYAPDVVLIDPYARLLEGASQWSGDGRPRPRHAVFTEQLFDWGDDQSPRTHLADSVIYELHVRGLTRHPSAGVDHPGTFLGLAEKIPYLKELGVTAVELMPVTEFEEAANPRTNPVTGTTLVDYWGYNPIGFFAPKAAYASDRSPDGPVREFRAMVKALHAAGIEVILDVVFNHTAEGDERGPTLSLRGLDNSTYYLVDRETGVYRNFSGCGNTLNCNHPVVRDLILDCLCYWVTEMHVDGFRFDLASILGRGRDGTVLSDPPVLERIAANPVLAGVKLIAEAWDAAGLYQVGSFPNWGRWAEWNGRFRDDIRRFVRGDPGMVTALAQRLTGSGDLYGDDGRAPYHSVNLITSHDGFTLWDMVSYNVRHNEENAEAGADGAAENFSWNCGEEGPSDSVEVRALRHRQVRNLATLLFVAHGVPMILAGDELGRTQHGNNNAYCHDSELTWVDWGLRQRNHDLLRFFRLLIRLRARHPVLRRRSFAEEEDGFPPVSFHGFRLHQPDWSPDSRSLSLQFPGGGRDTDILVMAHAGTGAVTFQLPPLADGRAWHRAVDTGLRPPRDIAEDGQEARTETQDQYRVGPRSVAVLIAR